MAVVLEAKEKKWLKNVFFYLTNSQKPSANNWNTNDFNTSAAGHMFVCGNSTADDVWQAASDIMDELDKKTYKDIDDRIAILATGAAYWDKKNSKWYQLSASEVSDAIAAMCAMNGIAWDPSKYTKYEVAYFDKTMFGQSLKKAWAAELNNGQGTQPAATQTTAQPASQHVSKPVTVQGTSTTGPHANITTAGNYIKPSSVHGRSVQTKTPGVVNSTYKQSGPQSQNAFDLKSAPGQKTTMVGDQGYLFVITAQDSTTTKNRPLVYVNPLINTGKYRTNTTNKVKFDSAHGYSDLVLYFNTPAEADAFMQKIIAAKLVPSKLTNVEVGKQNMTKMYKYFSHGFYEIGTELGNAMVCAYKLNEALTPEDEAQLDEDMITEPLEAEQEFGTKESYLEAVRKASRELSWD